jgi:L-fuconolactonase
MTEPSPIGVVDSHVHLWDQSVLSYPWLEGLNAIAGPYRPDLIPSHVGGATVENFVFVQAECLREQAQDEVDWVTSLAASDDRLSAIVAFAPLDDPGVAGVLERLQSNPMVKGVRWLIQGEAPGYSSRIVNGVQMLAGYDLSFDICVSHDQLSEALRLVDEAPETRFVLDHVGKPDIAAGEWSPWAEDIAAIAARENVWCKLSGMVTEAEHDTWTPNDLIPYAEHVLEIFGSGRVMFGSDWPVVTLASGYERWLTTARSMVTGSDEEIEAVFAGTARAFYRLTDDA